MPDRYHTTMRGALVALLVLLAQPCAHARLLRADAAVALPDYTIYHHKEDLLNKVVDIVKAHPDTMKMTVRSAGDISYNISMQVVDVDLGGAAHEDDNKVRLLVDFGEHAREYISSELGLGLLQALADPASIRALVGGRERADKLMTQLNRVTFKILPMENERGRDLVEGGKLCERKNGRGVDPNRNWEVDWGRKEKDYDPQEEYPGLKPFSEPESQIVLDLAKAFKPHVWLNIHSGMEAMFTPWDHIGEVAAGAKDALKILNTIKDSVFTDTCVVGSGGKSVGYLAHGTATDYMFERLHVPLAYTWEIYGDMNAGFNDCFRMFNPITKEHMQKIVTLWLKAIFRLVELLPTHPDIAKENIFTPTQSKATKAGATEPQQIVTSQTNGELTPDADPHAGHGQTVKAEDVPEVIVIHTPLHTLQRGSVWATLAFGVVAVALVGVGLYRYASTPQVGRKSPFEV